MTIFYPDVSSHQSGINLKGALIVSVKATEGVGYHNPDFWRAIKNSRDNGGWPFAYHFLLHGSGAAQALWCFKGDGGATWSGVGTMALMLDFEPIGDVSYPTMADALAFIDAFRKLGGVVHLVYLPRWYWDQIGRPSLKPFADRKVQIVSSNYSVPYSDSSNAVGWQPYGGMTPIVWQYSSTVPFNGFKCDFNGFRGHYAGDQSVEGIKQALVELKSIIKTGAYPVTPPPPPKPVDKTWRLWTAAGQRSLIEVGKVVQMTPSYLLHTMYDHFGKSDDIMYAYINAGDLNAKIPAGGKLWVYWDGIDHSQ